jgi:hypothetical protein
MDELEQKLKSARLAPPSEELERRMDEVFSIAHRSPVESRQRLYWWYLSAVIAGTGMAAVLIVTPRRLFPVPEETLYHIEAQGQMREMLLNSTAHQYTPTPFIIQVSPR